MLILRRKLNESIIIGDSIEIKITEISHDSVKLGITAPKNISVYREELYRKIKRMNESSMKMNTDVENLDDFFEKK